MTRWTLLDPDSTPTLRLHHQHPPSYLPPPPHHIYPSLSLARMNGSNFEDVEDRDGQYTVGFRQGARLTQT